MTVYRIQSGLFEQQVEKLRDELDFDVETSGGSIERVQTKTGKLLVNGQETSGLKVSRLLTRPIIYFYADPDTTDSIDHILKRRIEDPHGSYEDAMESLARFAKIQAGEEKASRWTFGRVVSFIGSNGWSEYFTNNFRG